MSEQRSKADVAELLMKTADSLTALADSVRALCGTLADSPREESIQGQIRECTAFAEKNGITVLRHYIDRAFSAKTDNRPEFQNMIKDSNKKLFDTVIAWKLDRFARNRYDSARHKATLKKNGVKVVSATEAIADGSVGIMMETILEGMAEYYSVDLSKRLFVV